MKKVKQFFKKYFPSPVHWAIGFSILGFLLIILFGFGFHSKSLWNWSIKAQLFEQYGSFIGGLVGSLFSLAGVFLIYETITKQRVLFESERYENQIFELIKYHRENVQQLKYISPNEGEVSGAYCFIVIEKEFQLIKNWVVASLPSEGLTAEQIFHVASALFVYGECTENKETLKSVLNSALKASVDTEQTIEKLLGEWAKDPEGKEKSPDSVTKSDYSSHHQRFNHYVRHVGWVLKQIVKTERIDDKELQKRFVKMFRSQLTIYEFKYLFHAIICFEGGYDDETNTTTKERWLKTIKDFKFFKPLIELEDGEVKIKKFYLSPD